MCINNLNITGMSLRAEMKVILPDTDITVASLYSLRDLALLVDFIFLFLHWE